MIFVECLGPGVEVIDRALTVPADLGLLEVSQCLVELFRGLLQVPLGAFRLGFPAVTDAATARQPES